MPPVCEPRSRVSISCAECRRLKLKCDKIRPCSNCVRRGCASICPQGNLVARGKRFILANTEQLHDKIDVLITRVRQLEDALETSQALHSTEPHPLLQEELRLIAKPISSTASAPERDVGEGEEELAEAVGTLTLDGNGSRYFGSTGAFANLWRDGDAPDDLGVKHEGEVSLVLSGFPPELANMAQSFPVRLSAGNVTHLGTWILENCLPPFTEAWSLFENYWEHFAWHLTPVTRPTFVEQILSPLYQRSPDKGDKPLGHRLALLFMVFAIGEYMDLTKPIAPFNGLRYYLLARASLCLNPVFEAPTVTALQAMHLLIIYLMMSRGTYEPESLWILSGINTKLALTLGLQHDAKKFSLPPAEIEARQRVAAAVLCTEAWQSLAVGRPSSCNFSDFDWAFAQGPDSTTLDPLMSERYWNSVFVRNCVSKTVDATVGNKVASYSAILQLDAKIRDYPLPPETSDSPKDQGEDECIGRIMQRACVVNLRAVCLLFLHKRFFAIALRDSPEDPLKSPFAPSVLACHQNAAIILSKIRMLHSEAPGMALRLWFLWPHLFVSTLVLGSIVARSPGCSLASSALLELQEACEFWETASSENACSPQVVTTIRKLKQKAFTAFRQNQAQRYPLDITSGGIEVSEEIHALGGGGPRVISLTSKSSECSSGNPVHSSLDTTFAPRGYFPPSDEPGAYAAAHITGEYVRESACSSTELFSQTCFSSTASPFDFPSIDFSAHVPGFAADMVPSDYDEIFRRMAPTSPTGVSTFSPTILEEFGLGGEWQPVMDDLGL